MSPPQTPPLHLQITLTPSKFQQLAHSLITTTIQPTPQPLKHPPLSTSQIHQLILLPRSTPIPPLQQPLKKQIPKHPHKP
ncbi:Hsp70 family protein, partial [Staphylococcus haemolyticus]|uniref:Hsp70 family protein n=1 Tax=Staphylococcus haemolyticus TaxID=1283 RepID=UPI00374F1ED8